MAAFELFIVVLAALVGASCQQHGAPWSVYAAATHGNAQRRIGEQGVTIGLQQDSARGLLATADLLAASDAVSRQAEDGHVTSRDLLQTASKDTSMVFKSNLPGPEPKPPHADLGDVQDGGAVRHLLGTNGAYGGTGRHLLQTYGAYRGTGRHLLQSYGAYGLGLPYMQDGSNRRRLADMEHAATIGRPEFIGHYGGQHKRAGSYGGSYAGGRH